MVKPFLRKSQKNYNTKNREELWWADLTKSYLLPADNWRVKFHILGFIVFIISALQCTIHIKSSKNIYSEVEFLVICNKYLLPIIYMEPYVGLKF